MWYCNQNHIRVSLILFVLGLCLQIKGIYAESDFPCGTPRGDGYMGVFPKWNNSAGNPDNCGGRGIYGNEYQCVEYVKRVYATVMGVPEARYWSIPPNFFAIDYYYHAQELGLERHPNSGSIPPQAGDILVFEHLSISGNEGHVAIITNVTSDEVMIAEQNWSSTGEKKLIYDQPFNTISNRGNFRIAGWLRKKAENSPPPSPPNAEQILNSTFTSDIGSPIIQIDGEYVYFNARNGNNYQILRVRKSGGSPEIIIEDSTTSSGNYVGITNIDFSASHLYYSYGNYGVQVIMEATKEGKNKRSLVTFEGGEFEGVFEDYLFYYTDFTSLKIQNIFDGSVVLVASGNWWPRSKVKDGDSLYFSDYNKFIYRFNPLTSDPPIEIATGSVARPGAEKRVLVGPEYVYRVYPGYLFQEHKSGGEVIIITLPDSSASVNAVSGNYIYYSVNNSQLWRIPISTSDGLLGDTQFITDTNGISFFSDQDYLYWIDVSNGESNAQILRVRFD